MRSMPGGAVCSMRAAMLTVMPRTVPSASTPPPSSTGPVWMPTRTSKPSCAWRWRTCSASRRPLLQQRQPGVDGALGVVFTTGVGANAASRLSPACCRTLPRWASTMAPNLFSAPSITAWMSSGSRRWLSVVEPTMSRNRTATCLSRRTSSAAAMRRRLRATRRARCRRRRRRASRAAPAGRPSPPGSGSVTRSSGRSASRRAISVARSCPMLRHPCA